MHWYASHNHDIVELIIYDDQLDYDIDYLKHINQHDNNQHDNQHNQHCAADHDNDDQHGHHDIIDHYNNHNRATLHRLMHMALVRGFSKMDQSLWR